MRTLSKLPTGDAGTVELYQDKDGRTFLQFSDLDGNKVIARLGGDNHKTYGEKAVKNIFNTIAALEKQATDSGCEFEFGERDEIAASMVMTMAGPAISNSMGQELSDKDIQKMRAEMRGH